MNTFSVLLISKVYVQQAAEERKGIEEKGRKEKGRE